MSSAAPKQATTLNWVVIPTYNEAENIAKLTRAVLNQGPAWHVLVVDDGSPDGTARIAKEVGREFTGRVDVLERTAKQGYGAAVLAGFRRALELGAERVFSMDCDWSHHPDSLPRLNEALDKFDVVIGSRYVPGGRTENWPFQRKLTSAAANTFARFAVGLRVHDCTGGFRGYRRAVLEHLVEQKITAFTYSFLTETLFLVQRLGYRVGEVPIVFRDREAGASKVTFKIITTSTLGLLGLARRRFKREVLTSAPVRAKAATTAQPAAQKTERETVDAER